MNGVKESYRAGNGAGFCKCALFHCVNESFRNIICIFRLDLAHTACGKRHQCRVSVSYGFFTGYCSLIAGFRKPSSKF